MAIAPKRSPQSINSEFTVTTHTIIDNFLPKDEFAKIRDYLLGQEMTWHFHDGIAQPKDGQFYWNTTFYMGHAPVHQHIYLLEPLINKIDPKAIVRIKANMYPKSSEFLHHPDHTDYPYEHLGCVFSINTCNGGTVLQNGTFVQSVANRILFFNPSIPHHSTTCTDTNVRVNINMNYF
jgi:hypothetical protein